MPAHQNLLVGSAAAARAVACGDLDMVLCAACGFVFNRAFDAALLDYGEAYENTQTCSPTFARYLDDLVADMVLARGVRNARIVEVGCGKGYFLSRLVAYPGAGNCGDGYDPSYTGPDHGLDGRVRFHREFYGVGQAQMPADVVVCRHVIEHVAQPLALLRNVRAALAASPRAKVFFETPCVEWILRNGVVWDFFYEHCSLFSVASLGFAFTRAGFRPLAVRHVFGEQYLWIEAELDAAFDPNHPAAVAARPPALDAPHVLLDTDQPSATLALVESYRARERIVSVEWPRRLARLRADGPVAIWGAGAKGVTFANLADPAGRLVEVVIDVNPNKQGRYLPGTGHRIAGPETLREEGISRAILMNPNYRTEIVRDLTAAGIEVSLIDWN